MSFKKLLNKRLLSSTLTAAVVLSTIVVPSSMAGSREVTDTFTGETSIVEDVNLTPLTPQIQAKTFRAMAAPMAAGNTLDPSDLSTWTVYDDYYDPSWGGAQPSNWDATHQQGSHPFHYWYDPYTNMHSGKFYDLSTAANIQIMEDEVLANISYDGVPEVAQFSSHIYTKGGKNDAEITFLGYGTNWWTNFALAPSNESGLQSVGFDIDAQYVNAHTLDGFGVMFNAGVDSAGTLRGYAVNFKMANHNSGTYNGTVYLSDLSSGYNAEDLHFGNPQYLPETQEIASFDLKQGIGKIRVDLDIEPTKVVVKYDYYVTDGVLSGNPLEETILLNVDTGYHNYGPVVNFSGFGHSCYMMSYVKFSNMVMSVDYDVIFDSNGGTTQASPDRIYSIPKDHSIKDEGHNLPTPPTKPGSTFGGWNTSPNGDGIVFDENTQISKITTVYAQWKEDSVITFVSDPNGSVSGTTSLTIPAEQQITSVANKTANSGYEFSHWEDAQGNRYQDADIIGLTPNGDMKFTAIFINVPVDVTYVAGANGTLTGGNKTVTISEGDPIPDHPTAPQPKGNKGYAFEGWVDESGNPVTLGSGSVMNDITLTAVFSDDLNGDGIADKLQNVYEVNFTSDSDGTLNGTDSFIFIGGKKGDGIPLKLSDVVENPFAIPNVKVNSSEASFKEWELTSPGSSAAAVVALLNGTLQINDNMTFNATYNLKQYDIKFVCSSKMINSLSGSKGSAIQNFGTAADPTAAQMPKSSNFQGWICPDGVLRSTAQVNSMNITGNMTFTAKLSSQLSVGRR